MKGSLFMRHLVRRQRFPAGMSSVDRSCSTIGETVEAQNTKEFRKTVKPMAQRPIVQAQRKRNEELEKKAAKNGLGWRIISATVLHRYPTILPEPEPWEAAMSEVQDKIEAAQREWLIEKIAGTPSQLIPDHSPSAEEILESMPFKPASRITEADLAKDMKSMDRRLVDSLFLLVKRNRSDKPWQFPQGKLLDTETTLRSAAERVIDRAVGHTNRWFISNAPIGHYCYEYPEAMQQQRKQFGAKVFFYRAQLIAGSVKLETRLYTDFAWVGRDEVDEYLDKDTASYMKELLPY